GGTAGARQGARRAGVAVGEVGAVRSVIAEYLCCRKISAVVPDKRAPSARRSTVLAVKVVDQLSVCGIVLGRQGGFAPPGGGGLRPALTACARCREGLP